MPKRTSKLVETIIYKSITFRRYPESENWSDANYYRPNSVHIRNGVQTLHRELWRDNHGAIPEGFEIHHKDGNPLNNELSNLALVTVSEHKEYHRTKSEIWLIAARDRLDKVRHLAAEWHGSDEGREWHKQHALAQSAEWQYKEYDCFYCKARFRSRAIQGAQFCSNACKSAYRRAQGLDNVETPCEHCGKVFSHNRYDKTRFCGTSCAARYRHQHKNK